MFKKNKLYYIQFLDHTMSEVSEDLMVAEVCGWVREVNKEKISVSTWNVITEDQGIKEANDSYYNLARKLIIDSKEISC